MTPKLHESPIVGGQAYADSYKFGQLDGSLTLRELFASHARLNPAHSLFMYVDEKGDEQHITYFDWYQGLRRTGSIVSRDIRGNYLFETSQNSHAASGPPVIGILASAGECTLSAGVIIFVGCTAFPLSPRNSALGIAHLVKTTGVAQLYVTEDSTNQELAKEAVALLEKEDIILELLPVPSFNEMYDEGGSVPDEYAMRKTHVDEISLIVHSSGSSSSFPTPVPMTTRTFLGWGDAFGGRRDLCGQRLGAMSLPMFHGMGTSALLWALHLGLIAVFYRPCSPPVIPTSENVLRATVESKCDILLCVPSFIEVWSQSAPDIAVLTSLKYLLYGGGPLNEAVGNGLARKGVKLRTAYGSTEAAVITVPFTAASDKDWNFGQIAFETPNQRVYLIPKDDEAGAFEPVIMGTARCKLPVANYTFYGQPAWATNDLLMSHPTRPGYYKVFGRADEQIMLSTGEKTNPVPLEQILRDDPEIAGAFIFGRGRPHNGILIQPTHPFDPRDDALLAKFRGLIWPTVQKVNDFAPTHSRIFKEMIVVTYPDKPLLYTDKGTMRRKIILEAYAAEIEAAYEAVDESSQSTIAPPDVWTIDSAIDFVRQAVQGVVKVELSDDDDFFARGCDSLQATWIRNTIIHAAKVSAKVPQREFPLNFVYNYPTIRRLGSFVAAVISGKEENGIANGVVQTDANQKLKDILELLSKYADPPFRRINVPASQSTHVHDLRTVVLTGSTGRLGCHVLAQLVANNNVERVYALNRESTGSVEALRKRQRAALAEWTLDPTIVDSPKITMAIFKPDADRLGLEKSLYDKILASITCFIHNGWRLDFNVGVKSFEPLIAGIRRIIDLGLDCARPGGAKIMFVSSIGAFSGVKSGTAFETLLQDPKSCIGSGYTESKWISEMIISRAREQTGLRTTSVRVGQLCGDSRTGAWNTKEWVPAMTRISQVIGALPSVPIDDAIAWIPDDIAASALIEMVPSSKSTLHLLSPRGSSWDAIFSSLAKALGLSLMPYDEWVAQVKAQQSELESAKLGSAGELIAFFQGDGARRDVHISTSEACAVSPTLNSMDPIGPDMAGKWLAYWTKVGFL